jgi:lysophospholipase L1-like esterase
MRFRSIVTFAFCVAALSCSVQLLAEDNAKSVARWEPVIAAFEKEDKESAPMPGGVVFYGSSSARLWNLKVSFPDLQTVNRGFGGSDMAAAAHYYDRVVPPNRPRVVVLYEGDNDLANGHTACQILTDFDNLIARHKQALPDAKLICLSVKYSPSRAKLRLDQEAVNALLKARCNRDPQLMFVDLASTLLDEQGEPQEKYFRPDMLHLNQEGYAQWNAKLSPVLEQVFQTK